LEGVLPSRRRKESLLGPKGSLSAPATREVKLQSLRLERCVWWLEQYAWRLELWSLSRGKETMVQWNCGVVRAVFGL